MNDHYEIVRHPNGGFAVIAQPTEDLTVQATKKDRRFTSPYEAMDYSERLSAKYQTRYSNEVSQEVRQRRLHGRREWDR